jgi:hypothetical protein
VGAQNHARVGVGQEAVQGTKSRLVAFGDIEHQVGAVAMLYDVVNEGQNNGGR